MKPLSLIGHTRALTRVRVNRDGDLLFTASKDHSPCVWFIENGERIGTYNDHNGVIWDIDVSWDTRTLVSSSGDPSVKIWDVETGKNLKTLTVSTVGRSVSLSYSGNLVAYTTTKVAMSPPMMFVADLRDRIGGEVGQVKLNEPSNSCVFSHLDDKIIVGSEIGHLNQYDLHNFTDAVNFSEPHTQKIQDLQVSSDQGLLISSSSDRTAQLHDANSLETLKTYKHGRPVNSAAISPTHDYIVLGGGEEAMSVTQTVAASGQFEAKLYHMVYENEFAFFKGHFGPINTLAYSPNGRIIVTGSEDGTIRIQDMDPEYFDYQPDY